MIPYSESLPEILKSSTPGSPELSAISSIYQKCLLQPLEEFLSRPKKSFRKKLILLGQKLTHSYFNPTNTEKLTLSENTIDLFDSVIEMLHSGSLIIDDIEDQSLMRRGAKTLHELHGIPLALNAGNWLYFWPLVMIQKSPLSGELKQSALAECLQTLLLAHTGQALDIGTSLKSLNPDDIKNVILKSIELKSGALTALALKLGALSYRSTQVSIDEKEWAIFYENLNLLGSHLGQILQFFDDIGNLTSSSNPQKQFEDLKLQRPSFVWVALAQTMTPEEFEGAFRQVVSAKDHGSLTRLSEELQMRDRSLKTALLYKQNWMQTFYQTFPHIPLEDKAEIEELIERLSHAY